LMPTFLFDLNDAGDAGLDCFQWQGDENAIRSKYIAKLCILRR
jgi:hypothetical protein